MKNKYFFQFPDQHVQIFTKAKQNEIFMKMGKNTPKQFTNTYCRKFCVSHGGLWDVLEAGMYAAPWSE